LVLKATRLFLVAGLALLLLVSGAVWYFLNVRPIEDAKNLVSQLLLDKESARFDKVLYSRENAIVCGYVNAKNKMGGYVGYRRFIVGVDKEVRFESDSKINCKAPSLNIPKFYGGSVSNYAIQGLNSIDEYSVSSGSYKQCLNNKLAELDKQIEFLKEFNKYCPDD
jgi:hypothetical protein